MKKNSLEQHKKTDKYRHKLISKELKKVKQQKNYAKVNAKKNKYGKKTNDCQ